MDQPRKSRGSSRAAGGAPKSSIECGGKLELKSLLLNNINNKRSNFSNVDRGSKRPWVVKPSKKKRKETIEEKMK